MWGKLAVSDVVGANWELSLWQIGGYRCGGGKLTCVLGLTKVITHMQWSRTCSRCNGRAVGHVELRAVYFTIAFRSAYDWSIKHRKAEEVGFVFSYRWKARRTTWTLSERSTSVAINNGSCMPTHIRENIVFINERERVQLTRKELP